MSNLSVSLNKILLKIIFKIVVLDLDVENRVEFRAD